MKKGIFQSTSDEISLGVGQQRSRDSQMGSKGVFQDAGADCMDTNENPHDPPYSNLGPKGTIQLGGADEVSLKKDGRNFAFSEQGSGAGIGNPGKA